MGTMGLLILAVLLSAFFSASETALISARQFKLDVMRRQGHRRAETTLNLLKSPDHFLTTILVGNNIAVVTASSLMATYLKPYFNGFAITAISAVLLLILGEIIPKTVAYDRPTRLSLIISDLLNGFYWLFFPVIKGVMVISRGILSLAGMEQSSLATFYTRQDLELLIRELEKTGDVKARESDMISRFLLRGRQKVREIMIPRTEIEAVSLTDSVEDAVTRFLGNGHSRMPVFENDIDHIIGMITAKDVILERPSRVNDILREVVHVPETGRVHQLLRQMRQKGLWMAIVVGEYGGTAGLVTLEDMVEEYFGEIEDEYDESADLFRKLTGHSAEVHARAEIDIIDDRLNLSLPRGEYQTLSGLLLDHFEKIPGKGEMLNLPAMTLTVLTATRKKVGWVRIEKKDPADHF